jgi:hypothetical protein
MTAAANSQPHVINCTDVFADHTIMDAPSRGEIVDGWSQPVPMFIVGISLSDWFPAKRLSRHSHH